MPKDSRLQKKPFRKMGGPGSVSPDTMLEKSITNPYNPVNKLIEETAGELANEIVEAGFERREELLDKLVLPFIKGRIEAKMEEVNTQYKVEYAIEELNAEYGAEEVGKLLLEYVENNKHTWEDER
jgi:hypothetical protein